MISYDWKIYFGLCQTLEDLSTPEMMFCGLQMFLEFKALLFMLTHLGSCLSLRAMQRLGPSISAFGILVAGQGSSRDVKRCEILVVWQWGFKVCNFKKPWNTGSRSHGSFLHLLRFDSCINALLPALSSYVFLYFKQACLLHYIIHMQIKYRCALCPSLRIIGPSKLAIIPAIQVQTLPLEGPRSLGFLIQGPNKELFIELSGRKLSPFQCTNHYLDTRSKTVWDKAHADCESVHRPPLRHYYSWQCSANVWPPSSWLANAT